MEGFGALCRKFAGVSYSLASTAAVHLVDRSAGCRREGAREARVAGAHGSLEQAKDLGNMSDKAARWMALRDAMGAFWDAPIELCPPIARTGDGGAIGGGPNPQDNRG